MSIPQNILECNEELKKLKSEAYSTKGHRTKNKLNTSIELQQTKLLHSIKSFLEISDESYRNILTQNRKLLTNNKIEFVVSRIEGNPFNSHATELKGSIHNNGFLYFTTLKTNVVWISLQRLTFPISYSGSLDCFGDSSVSAEKYKSNFFPRTPTKFFGGIDQSGKIMLKSSESNWESGNQYVNNIIADPFSGNSTKRNQFLRNRNIILKKIKQFRENL